MKHLQTKHIIKNIAKSEGLNISDVELMIDSQFLLLKKAISSSQRSILRFPSLRLPSFGIFYSPSWKVEKFRKINQEENEFI